MKARTLPKGTFYFLRYISWGGTADRWIRDPFLPPHTDSRFLTAAPLGMTASLVARRSHGPLTSCRPLSLPIAPSERQRFACAQRARSFASCELQWRLLVWCR